MGVATNVIAVGEVHRHAFAVETLRAHEMEAPAVTEASRNPSPQELRSVLDDLDGYAAMYTVSAGNWQAEVQATSGLRLFRRGTLVSAVGFTGDEGRPHVFYFEGGEARLNVRIGERLSRVCGPLYLFPDTGARPILVTAGLDPAEAVKVWERG